VTSEYTPPPLSDEPWCDGLCLTAADIGLPGDAVAYPHPSCPLHSPDMVCQCGSPDRCLSPTHGQLTHAEALSIRHRQRGGS
jgi:hypothetical protein